MKATPIHPTDPRTWPKTQEAVTVIPPIPLNISAPVWKHKSSLNPRNEDRDIDSNGYYSNARKQMEEDLQTLSPLPRSASAPPGGVY